MTHLFRDVLSFLSLPPAMLGLFERASVCEYGKIALSLFVVMVLVCYDPLCALQAYFEGVKASFNFNIIALDHKKKLNNNTFVGNTGHFHNEIDLHAQRAGRHGIRAQTTSSFRVRSRLPVGHSVIMMRRLKGFFALFPDFKKSAESDRQCGDDPAGGNFHAERSSNGSCRSRRAHQLMDAGGL